MSVTTALSGDRALYRKARQWIDSAIHELPAGVLWGPNAATLTECAEMLDGLEEFALACERLGVIGHEEFIEGCRWHFDHYPHYLERRRHFLSYASYVSDRHGPLRVPLPTRPVWQ